MFTSVANVGQITSSHEPVICGSTLFNEALGHEYVSEVEVQLYTFSAYVLERTVRSASHPGRFNPRYPSDRRLGP